MKRRPYLQRLPRAHFYVYDPNGIDYYQIRCQAPGVYYLLFFEGSVYYVLYGIFIYYVFYFYYVLFYPGLDVCIHSEYVCIHVYSV